MSNFPEDIKYTKSHEWVKKDGDFFLVGITDYAQDQLGDIVYVDFPEIGDEIEAGEALGEIESSKAVSEFNMPITGEVVEVNEILEDSPENLNSDPYGSWIVKIKAENSDDYSNLLNSEDAKKIYGEEN